MENSWGNTGIFSGNNTFKRDVISEANSSESYKPRVKRVDEGPFFPNDLNSGT